MNKQTEQRLQAWFDKELGPDEARAVEALLEGDGEARAYVEQLERMRASLQQAHAEGRMAAPAWEQLAGRLDRPAAGARRPAIGFPRMIGAVAAVMLLGIAVWLPFRQAGEIPPATDLLVDRVELVETDLEGATAVVYLDQPSGWTVIWVFEAEPPADI